MATIELTTDDGPLPVYVARPEGAGRWPGVVVLHDALGMTSDLRGQADWLASAGYLAVAPDLYRGGTGQLRCLFATVRDIVRRGGTAFDDVEATRRWLLGDDGCDGRIGVIGFCMGGGFAVLLAGSTRYDAASINYGAVPNNAMELLAESCPIVASYGGQDRGLRAAPARLTAALERHGVPHDVNVYPDAGHAFLNDHDPADVPRWAVVMGRLSTSDYHDESARDARRRIVEFFDIHLRADRSGADP